MFSKETYSTRRKTLASSVSGGLILLPGRGDTGLLEEVDDVRVATVCVRPRVAALFL
jgi:hypothetical protein